MTDIVERLRKFASKSVAGLYSKPEQVMSDAADEIERLREENTKLKEEVEDLNNRLIEAAEMADYHD